MRNFQVEYISPKAEDSIHHNRFWDWVIGLLALPFLFLVFTVSAYLAILEFVWQRVYCLLTLLMGRYEDAIASVIPQKTPTAWVRNDSFSIFTQALPQDLLPEHLQLTLAPEDTIFSLQADPDCAALSDVVWFDFKEEDDSGVFLIGVDYTQQDKEEAGYSLYYLGLDPQDGSGALFLEKLSDLPDFDWEEVDTEWHNPYLILTWHSDHSGLHTLHVKDLRPDPVLVEPDIS